MPSQDRLGGDIHGARGFFSGARRQQGDNRFLLLSPEICAFPGHLRTFPDIWPKSPVLRRGRFPSQLTCIFGAPEQFM